MATVFEVPQNLSGKTLKQIRDEGNLSFRPDLLGFNQDVPLKAGQQINFAGDIGSSEGQFLSGSFNPVGTAFQAKQKADEEGFLGALTERVEGQEKIGVAAERIGGELGLPALRQSAFDLTQTLKGIPQTQETISKQVGISAPNLQKRIASEQGRIAPLAQTAVSQQQFSEAELGNRLGLLMAEQQKELRPFFEAQLPLLQDRLAREQTNYTQDKQNELTVFLTKLSQGFQASQAELDRINQLATAELGYNQSLEAIRFSTDEAIRQATALKELKGTGGGADGW